MVMDGSLSIITHTMGALNMSPNDADTFNDLDSNGVWNEGEELIDDFNELSGSNSRCLDKLTTVKS